MRIRLSGLIGFVALSAVASTVRAQLPDSAGIIVGVVVSGASEEPLGFSIVSIPASGAERLTNGSGQFVFRGLRPGRVDLLVRHLGYTPLRLSLVARASGADTVRIRLTRLAVELNAVRVRARTACTNPGPPRAAADSAFAAIFEQLKQNADAYRLLAETYPFTYEMERKSRIRYVSGDEVVDRLDTVRVGTGLRWSYAPGRLVDRSDDPRNRQVTLNIPSLIHFADPVFLANHCFAFGGMDTADGSAAIRVDFAAASKIRAPDVDGSMYLDPATFQIRRSVLRLTKIPPETPEISSVVVVTEFRVLVPSIAIASSIESTHALTTDLSRPILPFAAYEYQRLLHVTFLKGVPH